MDEQHEQHLARILQNRRNRGVAVNSGAAVEQSATTSRFAPNPMSPSRNSMPMREQSPMARFPSHGGERSAPSLVTGTVPSLSYGGGPSSRSSSAMAGLPAGAPPPPPPFSQRPPPVATDGAPPPAPFVSHQYSAQYASGPTAAAYDNTVPSLGSGARSGSMVAVAPSYNNRAESVASMRAPTVDALLRRGTFENFRTNPVFVSTNIRPYNSSPQRGGGASAAVVTPVAAPLSSKNANSVSTHSLLVRSPKQDLGGTQRRPGFHQIPADAPQQRAYPLPSGIHQDPLQDASMEQRQHHSPPTMNAVAAATFSKPNPYRSQTFEDFCEAPHYDRNVTNDIVVPQHQRQLERNQKGLIALSPQIDGAPPLYDPQQSIAVLSQGDWFLKWTRIESAHRRYVWLDLNRGVISWAKSRDSSFFLQKSVKLEDIMDLQPLCTVDEESGRSFYQVMIVSTERVLKIGTELRDKFDVWFDTLQRLCEAQRVYTNTFIGRHAASNRTKPPHDFARRPAGVADGTE